MIFKLYRPAVFVNTLDCKILMKVINQQVWQILHILYKKIGLDSEHVCGIYKAQNNSSHF